MLPYYHSLLAAAAAMFAHRGNDIDTINDVDFDAPDNYEDERPAAPNPKYRYACSYRVQTLSMTLFVVHVYVNDKTRDRVFIPVENVG